MALLGGQAHTLLVLFSLFSSRTTRRSHFIFLLQSSSFTTHQAAHLIRLNVDRARCPLLKSLMGVPLTAPLLLSLLQPFPHSIGGNHCLMQYHLRQMMESTNMEVTVCLVVEPLRACKHHRQRERRISPLSLLERQSVSPMPQCLNTEGWAISLSLL
jgi:hypothetical protein